MNRRLIRLNLKYRNCNSITKHFTDYNIITKCSKRDYSWTHVKQKTRRREKNHVKKNHMRV